MPLTSPSSSIFSTLFPSSPGSPFSRKRRNKLRREQSDANSDDHQEDQQRRESTISQLTIMGQAQAKGSVPSHPNIHPSHPLTGNESSADLFHPPPPPRHPFRATHPHRPSMPEPPHSAPMVLTHADMSHDYAPSTMQAEKGSHRSKASLGFVSKPRSLARKLSTRTKLSRGPEPRASGLAGPPTVSDKMRKFEEMVAAAEKAAGISPGQGGGQGVSGLTSSTQARRQSISGILAFEPPNSAPPGPVDTIPFPLFDPKTTTTPARPSHHRRSSSNSTKSGKMSIKSTKRAEREWRARVAALAYASSPQSSVVHLRGPVPPKRTPAANRAGRRSRSGSPESDSIVTPPHSVPDTRGTPAKSIVSNHSFQTLGHYALSPVVPRIELGGNGGDGEMRDRKASVPHSVVSSFYFDPTSGSRVSTRPSSFAAGHMLNIVPSEIGSPLRQSAVPPSPSPTPPRPEAAMQTPAKDRAYQVESSQAFSFSPTTAHTPVKPPQSPALPESAIRPSHPPPSTRPREKRASAPAESVEAELRLRVAINPRSIERYDTIPPRSYQPPLTPGTPSGQSTNIPRAGFKLDLIPARATSSRTPARHASMSASIPDSPLSPTTAYLLTAPMESIDFGEMSFERTTGSPSGAKVGPARQHPYTTMPVVFDAAPATPGKDVEDEDVDAAAGDHPSSQSSAPAPITRVQSRPPSLISYDPFSAPPRKTKPAKVEAHDPAKPTKQQTTHKKPTRSTVLQPRKTQTQTQSSTLLLGSGYNSALARSELHKQREKLHRLGIDLTPGMESGVRPPKSGLPIDELHRWLSQTSIGSD